MHTRSCLVAAIVLALLTIGACDREFLLSSRGTADRFVQAFISGEFSAAADFFHYPPDLSEDELESAKESVRASLEYVARKLGRPSAIRPKQDEGFFSLDLHYRIGILGSDLPYQATRPVNIIAEVTYEADFPNRPDALLNVELIRDSGDSPAEIWQAAIMIPSEAHGSREYALALGAGTASAMGIEWTSEKTEFFEESVPDFTGLVGQE
jgi:hypothetical protein